MFMDVSEGPPWWPTWACHIRKDSFDEGPTSNITGRWALQATAVPLTTNWRSIFNLKDKWKLIGEGLDDTMERVGQLEQYVEEVEDRIAAIVEAHNDVVSQMHLEMQMVKDCCMGLPCSLLGIEHVDFDC